MARDDPGFVITVFLGAGMRADYDSSANAISIAITDAPSAERGDEVHPRAVVALAAGKPVEVQLLYPDIGISEPLAAVAERYELDREALEAAARSALAAPNRVVSVEVASGSTA
ncbi:MAG TPA: hypothetical protein VL979_04020 [Solirubrobacteraceae bacterium]|nr:hypothetical protein [Solirubrobacteraceae bacterium]